MITLKHKVLILFLFFSLKLLCFTPRGRTPGAGIRVFFGPAYAFYNINKNHAVNAVPKMSAMAGFRKEFRFDREYKAFFLFGVDYFFHGLNFKSYYFKQDSIKLYDKTFPYDYSLFIHEVNLPVQFKYSFTRENNSLYSPYIMAGYHLRYLLPGILNVSQNGDAIINDDADLKFKNPLIYNKINSFISIAAGWQKNRISSSRSSFFVEADFRYGFSPYYFAKDYAPSSLFISSTHIGLHLGLKF